MANLIGSHSGWAVSPTNTSPSFTADPGAAQDVALVLVVCYATPESPDANNWQATWGGESATARSYDQSIGAVTQNTVVFQWDSQAAAARQNNSVSTTNVADNYPMSYAWFLVENAKAGAPLQELVINGQDSLVAPSQAVTLNGAADYQVGMWNHHGTFNRTFTPDADFTTIQNEEVSGGGNWEYGVSDKAAGGETDYTVGTNLSDAFPFLVIGMTFDSPSSGFSFTSVDGGTTVRADRVLGAADNRAVAYVENGSNVTSVELNGVTQADFAYSPASGEVPETIRFSTTLDNTADTAYGNYVDGLVFKDADGAGNDVSVTVDVAPPLGSTYSTAAGLPAASTSRSIFRIFEDTGDAAKYGFNAAAVTDGDQFEYETETSAGFSVSITDQGVASIGGGSEAPQTFYCRVRRSADSNQWTPYVPVFVNHRAIVTAVNGAAGPVGSVDVTDAPIVLDGDRFGAEQLDGEVWTSPDSGDGSEVLWDDVKASATDHTANVTAWGNTQVTLSGLASGVEGGADLLYWVHPDGAPA